jgi:hypothetical protein
MILFLVLYTIGCIVSLVVAALAVLAIQEYLFNRRINRLAHQFVEYVEKEWGAETKRRAGQEFIAQYEAEHGPVSPGVEDAAEKAWPKT